MPRWSLRQDRAESSRLAWAVMLSLAVHLAVLGTYTAGRRFHWWDALRWPAWLQPAKKLAEMLRKKPDAPPPQPHEAPLLFVEVTPEQAVAAPPKEAKFYSNKNAVAANPEANRDADMPKITGTQKQVIKTETAPREKYVPLQPSPPPAPKAAQAQEEAKPKPAQPPGDLAMAKPEPTLRKDEGSEAQARPRTLEEARARQQQKNPVLGEKMNMDGGVTRHRQFASLDTKETPFGDYDAELVEAISQRWYSLLDQRDYASDGRGKVVVQFTLNYDGRVTDVSMEENSVGEVLGYICQKAVQDPSPFKPWPREMRRLQGDTRHIQFTFYYN